MRGRIVLAFLVAVLVALPAAAADVVVLKDGRTILLAKPYLVKGKMAVLTLPDKTILSVPIAEIDKAKTAEAKARPAPAAAPAPTPARPMTPAEAAKVKSTKKAIVSLTDDSVTHPAMQGAEGTPAAEGGSRVEVGSVTVKREKSGYSVQGSLSNKGKAEAVAITLTVEALGDDGKTVASGFAEIAKDTLTAGEKTTFTAQIPTEVAVSNFSYTPRWKEKGPSRLTIASGSEGGQEAPAPATEPPATEVKPPAGEGEAPKPQPRPDVAAPPAQAPVGTPAEPGGVYVPQPSPEGQPKLP